MEFRSQGLREGCAHCCGVSLLWGVIAVGWLSGQSWKYTDLELIHTDVHLGVSR
jgi:hypothetical protein